MDPVVQGALIAACSALGAGAIATGSNLSLESRRQKAQDKRDEEARLHEERQARYDERKAAYRDFYEVVTAAERSILEFEERNGVVPADMGYDEGNQSLDDALARIQFDASDDVLAAAEQCSKTFYAWGWGSGSHTDLYSAMNEFVRVVRDDLGINPLTYKRPLPAARPKRAPKNGDAPVHTQ